jgi:hypothetical protein
MVSIGDSHTQSLGNAQVAFCMVLLGINIASLETKWFLKQVLEQVIGQDVENIIQSGLVNIPDWLLAFIRLRSLPNFSLKMNVELIDPLWFDERLCTGIFIQQRLQNSK